MRPPETVTAEPTERLAPTGSRLPVWYRLPDEPPLATYPDQPRPDDDTEALVARRIDTFMPPRPAAEDKAAPKGRGSKV